MAGLIGLHFIHLVTSLSIIGSKLLIQTEIHTAITMVRTVVKLGMIKMLRQEMNSHLMNGSIPILMVMDMVTILQTS